MTPSAAWKGKAWCASTLDYDGYLGIDAESHRRIFAAARNRLLSRLYEDLQVYTQYR